MNKHKSQIKVKVVQCNKVCRNLIKILKKMSKIFHSLKTIKIVGYKPFIINKDCSSMLNRWRRGRNKGNYSIGSQSFRRLIFDSLILNL